MDRPTGAAKLISPERHRSGGIACRRLACWVQRFEECHQSRRLRRTQILTVCRHISSALDHLPNQLIFIEAESNFIECWPALTSFVIQRMTVVTLLCLKDECSVALQRRSALQEFWRNRLAAPRIHDRAPRRVLSQVCQSAESYCDQQNRENRNRPAPPALLAFACDEGKRQ